MTVAWCEVIIFLVLLKVGHVELTEILFQIHRAVTMYLRVTAPLTMKTWEELPLGIWKTMQCILIIVRWSPYDINLKGLTRFFGAQGN